jgi:Flp pilus assembly protein TadG
MPIRPRFRLRHARSRLFGSAPPAATARRRLPWRHTRLAAPPRGQALVEFAAVLLPILLLIVGVIQFGLLFGASVTLTNAVRESARAATIYVYDNGHTKTWNDAERCGDAVDAARQSMGMLSTSSAHFSTTQTGTGACPTPTGDGQVNGDLTISYCDHVTTPDGACPDTTDPDTTCPWDNRESCLVRVTLVYRSDIIVPFIGALIGQDSSGRFAQTVTATMVVN